MEAPPRWQALSEGGMTQVETPLSGGLVAGRVVRIGDTVRREAGPWSSTHQALLAHLQAANFPSPRPLGFDAQGREMMSFIEGRPSNWPWPQALLATEGARMCGAFLRRFHVAVAGFTPPAPPVWRHGPQPLAPNQIVLHGDFGPHNLIWRAGAPCGLIDFELARPGDPMEDAGFAVVRVAQLRADELTRNPGFSAPPDRASRFAAFADGYGCARSDLVAAALAAQRDEIHRIASYGAAGLEPWATFRAIGLESVARAELTWIEANAHTLA
jgi:hypothetical protein